MKFKTTAFLVNIKRLLVCIFALFVFLVTLATVPAFAAYAGEDCNSLDDPIKKMTCLYDQNGDGEVNAAELGLFKGFQNSAITSLSAANDCEPLKERLEHCEDAFGRCRRDDGCPGCKAGVTLYCATFPKNCCK